MSIIFIRTKMLSFVNFYLLFFCFYGKKKPPEIDFVKYLMAKKKTEDKMKINVC